MFNVPVESVKNPSEERQIGKVSELAFGYQGGVGSVPHDGEGVPGDQRQDQRRAGRRVQARLARRAPEDRAGLEATIQRPRRSAPCCQPGEKFSCGAPGRQATYRMVGSFLWCLLPSGRAICYPFPVYWKETSVRSPDVHVRPSQEDRQEGQDHPRQEQRAELGARRDVRGSLFNNIVQGFCRDFLADLLLWLDDNGAGSFCTRTTTATSKSRSRRPRARARRWRRA
jgi:hypothetical protein